MAIRPSCITITEKDWETASADQRGWWTYQTLQSLNERLDCLEKRPFIHKCFAFAGGVLGGFLAAMGMKVAGGD